MTPPAATDTNIEDMDAETRKQFNISMLPGSLHEALQSASNSTLLRRTLGDHIFRSFIENKTIEWERYREHVSDYELRRYLPLLQYGKFNTNKRHQNHSGNYIRHVNHLKYGTTQYRAGVTQGQSICFPSRMSWVRIPSPAPINSYPSYRPMASNNVQYHSQ